MYHSSKMLISVCTIKNTENVQELSLTLKEVCCHWGQLNDNIFGADFHLVRTPICTAVEVACILTLREIEHDLKIYNKIWIDFQQKGHL